LGTDAQKIGLVDDLGGLNAAIAYAVAQTNLGQDWEIAEYPQKKSLEAAILGKLFNIQAFTAVNPSDPLTVEWEKFKQELGVLQTFNDPKSVYARLPFNWIFN
jgi:protease-4